MKELDDKYRELARDALFMGLHNCKIQDDVSIEVDKSEVLHAFSYSGGILRSNFDDHHYQLMAETVFETCIRFTRCVFFPKEARTIVLRGSPYSIVAEQQLDVLRKTLRELELYKSD